MAGYCCNEFTKLGKIPRKFIVFYQSDATATPFLVLGPRACRRHMEWTPNQHQGSPIQSSHCEEDAAMSFLVLAPV